MSGRMPRYATGTGLPPSLVASSKASSLVCASQLTLPCLTQPFTRSVSPRSASRPDAVQSAHGVRAVDDREGRQVARGAREPAHDDEPPDSAVLVHDAVAGDEGLVLHHHVPAQGGARRHDDVAPQLAVVADV